MLLSESIAALPLGFCTFACNIFSLLSFKKYSIQLYYRSCNIRLIERPQKFVLKVRVVNLGPVYTIPGSGFPGILDL